MWSSGNFLKLISHFYGMCVCSRVPWNICGGQGTASKSQLFSFTMEVPRIELRLLGLVTSTSATICQSSRDFDIRDSGALMEKSEC